jgi:hypothetical protein
VAERDFADTVAVEGQGFGWAHLEFSSEGAVLEGGEKYV